MPTTESTNYATDPRPKCCGFCKFWIMLEGTCTLRGEYTAPRETCEKWKETYNKLKETYNKWKENEK